MSYGVRPARQLWYVFGMQRASVVGSKSAFIKKASRQVIVVWKPYGVLEYLPAGLTQRIWLVMVARKPGRVLERFL